MVISVLFSLLIVGAGAAVLRLLGLSKGLPTLGLAPAAGLASLAVVCTWPAMLGAPAPLPGLLLAALGVTGLVMAIRDRAALREALAQGLREQRAALVVLAAALLVPLVAMRVAFADVEAPLSPHDGAFHTQLIHLLRAGAPWPGGWYPPGLHAIFAAALQLVPWVDSAQGSFDLGLALSLLAPLVVFGLGCAILHDLRMAAAGALLISLVYLFPYFEQMWSGWPLGLSLLLALGLWAAAVEYVERPSWRWAALAGLLLGAMVLVHGSELYTAALLLLLLLIGAWRRLAWRRLPGHLGLAAGVAVGCALPYLPLLFRWAGAGAAISAGTQDGGALESGMADRAVGLLAAFGLNTLGVDLPVRLVLIPAGVWWVVRRQRGRLLAAVTLAFVGLTLAFTLGMQAPLAQTLYALTFPWGMAYRLLMVVGVGLALLGGVGAVALAEPVLNWTRRPGRQRLGRLARVLIGTWLVLSVSALTFELRLTASGLNTTSPQDAAAMGWLRAHAEPGEVLANDWYADDGIWAPFKAGVTVLMAREQPVDSTLEGRRLVLDNIGDLEAVPAARQAACELGVAYVYHGAQPPVAGWEPRHFPPLEVLRQSSALEEVFSDGEAAVFRTRLDCPGFS